MTPFQRILRWPSQVWEKVWRSKGASSSGNQFRSDPEKMQRSKNLLWRRRYPGEWATKFGCDAYSLYAGAQQNSQGYMCAEVTPPNLNFAPLLDGIHVETCVRKGKMSTRSSFRNVLLLSFNATSAYFCISRYSSYVRSSQHFMTLPADSSKTLIPIGMMRSYTRNLGASSMQSISTFSTMSSYPR